MPAPNPPSARVARVKELVSIEGVRENQLIGYGIVVGLNGTGDKRQTFFSAQTLANMLDRLGVQVNPQAMLVRNMAAVMVTANLPAFAQPGQRIDVTASAIGDATNLQGGVLVATPLRGLDGQVYAIGQGAVVTGGFSAGGGGNAKSLNHPTAGRLPAGALVERAAPSVAPSGALRLQLRVPDFTTAARIAGAVNLRFPDAAKPESSGTIRIEAPPLWAPRMVEFIAEVENLTLEADRPARIVVNERTGTIVMGKQVSIAPVAIMHGALSVEIQTTYEVTQPLPLSQGQTAVTPNQNVSVKEEKAKNIVLKQGATIEELVRALQAIGSTPRDIIAILQNLRSAGAIEADLEVI